MERDKYIAAVIAVDDALNSFEALDRMDVIAGWQALPGQRDVREIVAKVMPARGPGGVLPPSQLPIPRGPVTP